jgi:hypothetical protein
LADRKPPSDAEPKGAATLRQEKLAETIGLDFYARFPQQTIEALMDRAPAGEAARIGWKPLAHLDTKSRVYWTYIRYSWCWPICMEYAVVTGAKDDILRDHMERPLVLSEEAVGDILGLSKQRVSDHVLGSAPQMAAARQAAPPFSAALAQRRDARGRAVLLDSATACAADARP